MSAVWRSVARCLRDAERSIALVERCRPIEAEPELRAAVRALGAGREHVPLLRYAPPPELGELRKVLAEVATHADSLGVLGRLYAGRARELALEAELAEHVGKPGFAGLAARRFGMDGSAAHRRAEQWAKAWVAEAARESVASAPTSHSDDESDPDSLVSSLRRAVGGARLPFRVLLSDDLLSAAATGDSVILVRTGLQLSGEEVGRIVCHELEGHARPRARSRSEASGLFQIGSAGSGDDEEGRALALERKHGHLGLRRRAELGRRHLGALAVRDGADWLETLRLLLASGAQGESAVRLTARLQRGGGLAREIVYLPALVRVERALRDEPELDEWLGRGRLSIEAARALASEATQLDAQPVSA